MDLSTNYLGMRLRSPLVPSASPLSEEIGNIQRMEDAGAAAVVLYSLFEEQISLDRFELHHHLTHLTNSFVEAQSFFPEMDEYQLGPEEYLDHIRQTKEAVDIPIIASLNGYSLGGWVEYARLIEQAGADALELNIYFIPTDLSQSSASVEKTYIDILKAVKAGLDIPVAVKLSPYFSNMAYMAAQLDEAGADALVLFNRFYQPDIDLEELDVVPNVLLSTSQAMRLPLTWVGILHGRIRAGLAATGGIHSAQDVLKMLMVGADVTMLCSVLLAKGINTISEIEQKIVHWMQENEYKSVRQLQGSMSQEHSPDPSVFERSQYMYTIHGHNLTWKVH